MRRTNLLLTLFAITCLSASSYAAANDDAFKLALVNHPGQLSWSAEGFKIIESSAKPGGNEIGIRGQDQSGQQTFLGFLFLFPEEAPLNSAKCLDGVIGPEKKSTVSLKIAGTDQISQPGTLPVSLVSYTARGEGGKTLYTVRGFVANGDICGDLEIYSYTPLSLQDANLKKIFSSLRLDEKYTPQFNDLFLYAQILYQHHMYGPAAPVYEKALAKLNEDSSSTKTMKRVITDQAGMSYGMSGNIAKARAIFEKAVVADPDYPLYYYNLACADAEEKNLTGAKKHLQEAFDRKANVVPGERMPDPTQDDSFLPYRKNKEFWAFVEGLRGK
ncbi:MAG TPA: tetratricopeptide repeat protein [Candidatus Angelobacter sp.]|nr:tetratricopeptide repeat protein [Candidatus Angelobacter sp.]